MLFTFYTWDGAHVIEVAAYNFEDALENAKQHFQSGNSYDVRISLV